MQGAIITIFGYCQLFIYLCFCRSTFKCLVKDTQDC